MSEQENPELAEAVEAAEESTIDPGEWAADGPDVIEGVEEVDQDPDLFAGEDVVEIFVEPGEKA